MQNDQTDYILTIEDLVVAFGGLMALYKPDIKVKRGTITSVIGPNGAGKTTLFNIITGFLTPNQGRLVFNGQSLKGKKPHQIAGLGISRTFQTVEIFDNMTVLENILLGFHIQESSSFLFSGLRTPGIRKKEKLIKDLSRDILRFIGLDKKANEPAANLPLGEQKILEIGRALAGSPVLICLDEPAAGLNETETHMASSLIKAIKEKGITVLLVEHDMKVIMNISDEIFVLSYGRRIAQGSPEEIQKNKSVITAYLGEDADYA